MKQTLLAVLLLLVGAVLGGTVVIIGQFQQHPTEIWTAQQVLTTADGIVVPAETELRVLSYQPDGSVMLELFLQVEGETRDLFTKKTDARSNLVIPHPLQHSP